MQNKNHWYRNFRFKLFAVLCAVMLLGQGLFTRPVLARPAAANDARALATSLPKERNPTFSVISRGAGKLDAFVAKTDGKIWMKSFNGGWSNWTNLGGAPTGESLFNVSAVAAGNNRWDIFATATNNLVWHLAFDGTFLWTWESMGSVGNVAAQGVQAVSTGNGQISLLTRSTSTNLGNGSVLYKTWTASGGWKPSQTGWSTLDNTMSPMTFTALAHSGNRLDLFRRLDSDQSIGRKWWDGTKWSPINPFNGQSLNMWGNMSGLALYTPYAVSWGTNRIDVLVRGMDTNIYINNTDNAGASWWGWASLAGSCTANHAAVSAVAWGPNRLDLFTICGIHIEHKAWTGTSWSPSQNDFWEVIIDIPYNEPYPPLPVSWGPNRIDLFRYDISAGQLKHGWTNGNGWEPTTGGWENLGPN